MSTIDEVKQKTDIVEVVGQYLPLTKAGRVFKGLCPFHSEKHPSFFVYPERQSWHCFGACNTGGDVLSFVMKKEDTDFGTALRLLAERAGVALSVKFEPEAGGKEKERLYQINQAAAQYFYSLLLSSPVAEKALNYVTARGFSSKTIDDFQLGFSPNRWEALTQYLLERGYTEDELLAIGLIIKAEDGQTHDRFRNRLMFPIFDTRGRITGFGARVLDDSLPKYVNSPQTPIFDKSGILYGINRASAAIRQQDLAVIVEGYMDVITAHQNGFNNVVASMGTSITEKQVNILKRITRNIALALDADTAGEEAMLRCVGYENMLDAEIKVIILPSGRDPDDVIKEDTGVWQKLLGEALPVIDYTFGKVASTFDLTTAKGKSLVVDRLLPIIAGIKNDIRRDHYLRKAAELIGVSYSAIEAALSRIKPDRRAVEPRKATVERALQPMVSSPLEQDCLTLLLQHPELKGNSPGLLPEYFESSENREIFTAWQQTDNPLSLKEKLDMAIHDYTDSLAKKNLPAARVERRYADYALRLRERFLRSLEAKRAEVFALEAESGGTAAELAKLEEQGIEVSVQLGEVFNQRAGQEQQRR